ncbi:MULTISPECIES: hypothetical protein [unclassified Okeania]|nr:MULTISPECIES: hypothetical protein [unclassified Okeania]
MRFTSLLVGVGDNPPLTPPVEGNTGDRRQPTPHPSGGGEEWE